MRPGWLRGILPLVLTVLRACTASVPEQKIPCAASQACLEGAEPTDPLDTTDDDGPTPADTGIAVDTAAVDTGLIGPDDDTATCDTVTFVRDDATLDLTDAFLTGTPVRLKQPGTLEVCPGVWFAQVVVAADVTIAGLGTARDETVLSGGEQLPPLAVSAGQVEVRHLVLDRGSAAVDGKYGAGGGLRCTDAELLLEDVTLSNHVAYDGAAGHVGDGCTLTLRKAEVLDNDASDDGGAFRISDGGAARFEEVRFAGNRARDGGALAIFEGEVSLETSLFEDNVADDYGGAISNWYGQLEATSSVIRGNTARFGGAMSLAGTSRLSRVTLEGHLADDGGAVLFHDIGRLEGTDVGFSDNAPDDVRVHGTSETYTWSDSTSFVCDAGRCTTK